MIAKLQRLDDVILDFMQAHAIKILRYALGIVFVWFGALKLFDISPVSDLVGDTVYWLPETVVVPALGAVEIFIGLGLITGFAIRIVLLVFFLQMLGTFLTFVIKPEVTFANGNPFHLTVIGEFVLKNVVLLAAGIAVGSAAPRSRPDKTLPEMLTERVQERG